MRELHWNMRRTVGLLLALTLVPSLIVVAQRKDSERPARHPSRGLRGAVAGGSEHAVHAGMRMLHRGGNAVDAGVAATLAASIVEFSHFGFGGEAPILIRTKDGRVVSIAGIGTMPQLASAELFRTRRLQPGEVQQLEPNGLKGMIPVAGLMPALVPGMVEAVLVALREFGTLRFADVVAPAIDLAGGTPIDEIRANYIGGTRKFYDLWPASKRIFMPNGRPPRPGDIFVQADLARTLRLMVEAEQKAAAAGASRAAAIDAVRDLFYRGSIAARISAFSEANDGLLRASDMAQFRLAPEEAPSVEYRGYRIYKPGFWSQGPAMLEALHMLEGFDLRSLGNNSPEYLHTLAEAMKLAYADRDTWYGDPKVVEVPASQLLSRAYAEARKKEIGAEASHEFRPGRPGGKLGRHPSETGILRVRIDDALMARDTTCINVVDKEGIMFAATPSGAWLPSVIAGDTGIPLTQRAQSFLLIEGHPNELAGGKRPRVTLSPTLVTRKGRPEMVLATPGGDVQEQAQLQVMLNAMEFGMNPQSAVEAPRFQTRHLVSSFDNHAMNPGDLLLDERIPQITVQALAARGHKVARRSRWASGSAPVIIRVLPSGVIEAGADPYGYRVASAW